MKDRDLKIVQLISEGNTSKQIGAALDLSGRTVENLIAKIREEHGAKSQAHLIAILCKKGVLKWLI